MTVNANRRAGHDIRKASPVNKSANITIYKWAYCLHFLNNYPHHAIA